MMKTLLLNYIEYTDIYFKDGKSLSITIRIPSLKRRVKAKIMIFKDSYKLLPLSLNSLIKEYKVTTQKLKFPYKFLIMNKLTYKGKLPDKEFYDDITDYEYQVLESQLKKK